MTSSSTNERREFLRRSTALALTASLGPALTCGLAWSKAVAPLGSTGGPQLVLFDPRHAQSRAFADALHARGAMAFSTTEVLGALWYGRLGRAFAEPAARLTGLTPYADYFVCASFAREPGARGAYAESITTGTPAAADNSGSLYSWSLVRAARRG